MRARPLLCFVLGGPGAGKTLQSRLVREALLREDVAVHHTSAGELLRAFVAARPGGDRARADGGAAGAPADWSAAEESDWRRRCGALLAEGAVVPSEVTVRLLARAMARAQSDAARGIIIDGFPRNESNRTAFVELVRAARTRATATPPARRASSLARRHHRCGVHRLHLGFLRW